ncbi:Transcription initiation factor TFIID subunit 5 [Zea mays]|uniref:Transcription initiation factor TFIID subunit 5 n=1 Tax=Zea mays TaxID=4577 RepID=A0A1D6H6T3_MAIZE|nr:Transcription initiation factor TFIID subunit 5 [Zea mays]
MPILSVTKDTITQFGMSNSAQLAITLLVLHMTGLLEFGQLINPAFVNNGWHLSDVDCVQWHVNCNYIATGSSDKTVRLWDVQTGECIRMFIGHRSMVLSLAMSPDGRYMASGDEDGTIMIWDLSTGRCVSPLLGHNSCVWTLAFR